MIARQCYRATLKRKKSIEILPIEGLDTRDKLKEQRGELAEELAQVPLKKYKPDQTVWISSNLSEENRGKVINCSMPMRMTSPSRPNNMLGLSSKVLVHRLNVDPTHRLV